MGDANLDEGSLGDAAELLDAIDTAFLASTNREALDAAWRAHVAPVWDRLDAETQEEISRMHARHLSTLSWSQ